MKVADLILLLAPLSGRTISLRHGDRLMDLDRECLQVLDDESAAFEMPAPARASFAAPVTLDDALRTLTDWVRNAESRIATLEENGPAGIDYSELAEQVNMSNLADEIDKSDLADYLDVDDTVESAVNDTLRDARFRLA